jgi:hypothetical protein
VSAFDRPVISISAARGEILKEGKANHEHEQSGICMWSKSVRSCTSTRRFWGNRLSFGG